MVAGYFAPEMKFMTAATNADPKAPITIVPSNAPASPAKSSVLATSDLPSVATLYIQNMAPNAAPHVAARIAFRRSFFISISPKFARGANYGPSLARARQRAVAFTTAAAASYRASGRLVGRALS